jgi:hypothetical protein
VVSLKMPEFRLLLFPSLHAAMLQRELSHTHTHTHTLIQSHKSLIHSLALWCMNNFGVLHNCKQFHSILNIFAIFQNPGFINLLEHCSDVISYPAFSATFFWGVLHTLSSSFCLPPFLLHVRIRLFIWICTDVQYFVLPNSFSSQSCLIFSQCSFRVVKQIIE